MKGLSRHGKQQYRATAPFSIAGSCGQDPGFRPYQAIKPARSSLNEERTVLNISRGRRQPGSRQAGAIGTRQGPGDRLGKCCFLNYLAEFRSLGGCTESNLSGEGKSPAFFRRTAICHCPDMTIRMLTHHLRYRLATTIVTAHGFHGSDYLPVFIAGLIHGMSHTDAGCKD